MPFFVNGLFQNVLPDYVGTKEWGSVTVRAEGIVYVYKQDEKVVYVGQTTQLLEKRDAQHLRESITAFDRSYENAFQYKLSVIKTISISRKIVTNAEKIEFLNDFKDTVDTAERHYIELLKPVLNTERLSESKLIGPVPTEYDFNTLKQQVKNILDLKI